MAVKNGTIITKMMNELLEAKHKENDQTAMKRHISNVQLLCDLILDESVEIVKSNEITDHEIQAMVGATKQEKGHTHYEMMRSEESPNVTDKDGDSIFDF